MKHLLTALLWLVFLPRMAGQTPAHVLQITPLTGDFYIFTTYQPINGSPYPANGMYLVTTRGIVLFDTPWDSTQFQPLLDSLTARYHKNVILCVSTHFHEDRTGGLDFLREHGVATWSSEQTRELCRKRGQHQAQFVFTHDTVFVVGNYSFRTFYPGEGHSKDNIVIWFGKERILYGGCFVKSTETNNIGNISDANVAEWPRSMQRVMDEFPDPRYIIPGHLGWADNRSLQHTLEILRNTPSQ